MKVTKELLAKAAKGETLTDEEKQSLAEYDPQEAVNAAAAAARRDAEAKLEKAEKRATTAEAALATAKAEADSKISSNDATMKAMSDRLTALEKENNQLFQKAVLVETTRRLAFIQSGIAAPDAAIAATIASGKFPEGSTINMNFVNRWDANIQPALSDTATVPDKTTMGQDVAAIIRRNTAFDAEALAKEMADTDFVQLAVNQIADVKVTYYQKLLGYILNGVFANNALATGSGGNGGDLILDITGETGADAVLSPTTLLLAAQKLGDAKSKLSAIIMHSQAETFLNSIGSISYVAPAANMPAILPMYNGRRVLIDDEAGAFNQSTGIAEITLFAPGAVAFNEVPRANPYELTRVADYDRDQVWVRFGCVMHLRGIKFVAPSTMGATPLDSELSAAASWKRVWDKKHIGCCRLKCKLG